MNHPTCMKLSSEDGEIHNLLLEKENKDLIKSHTVLQISVIMMQVKDTESPITLELLLFSDFMINMKK